LIFWIFGIIALILLFDFSLAVIRYSHEKQITNFILISYLVMVLFIFILLLTELSAIFGIIAGIVGLSALTIYPYRKIKMKSIDFSSVPATEWLTKQQNRLFNLKLRYHSLFLILLIVFNLIIGVVPGILVPPSPINNTKLSGMSYNLHFGLDSFGYDNIDRASQLILSETPSFIGLQEVTFNSPLNGYKNMFDALKKNLSPQYPYYYYSERQTGVLSNAFFSLYPIISASTITLEPTVRYQRNMLNIVLDVEGSQLRVVVLHLTHIIEKESNPDRVKQAEFVINQINSLPTLPTIILGDFNAWPEFPEAKVFSERYQDGWNTTNPNLPGYTWPTLNPSQRIDYIFLDNSINITNCEVIQNYSSDHFPLECEFEL
jgi:endonuclease/exonuclease/phosphatase family metal-dependent hydrolase